MTNYQYDASDILVHIWPDGSWCYTDELWQMDHKSDDYETRPASQWQQACINFDVFF